MSHADSSPAYAPAKRRGNPRRHRWRISHHSIRSTCNTVHWATPLPNGRTRPRTWQWDG